MNGITKLVSLALPSGTVYLSDGGVTVWGGNTYRATDATLGSIAQYGRTSFGFSSVLPQWDLVFAPPSNAALTPLQAGAFARSVVRYCTAEFDVDTGAVVGDPHLEFAGRMDRVRQPFGLRQLAITISCAPEVEVLLFSDEGNGLSAEFHKSLYAGETGHDQATGLVKTVTWGAESARRSNVGGAGGGGGPFAPGGTPFDYD